MTRKQLGESFDTRVARVAEWAARRVSRRNALRTVILGGAIGVSELAVGQSPAWADACTSNCGPTRRCSGCHPYRCPTGYSLCHGSFTSNCFNNQGYRCEWPAGEWVACTGLGKHHHGIRICLDCIHGKTSSDAACDGWCTCLTECLCCHCTTAADVKAEQQRMMSLT
jgi:hypothetical protein